MRNPLYVIIAVLGVALVQPPAMAQRKVVSELTLVYEYSATSQGKPDASENAIHTVYIKGNKSRSEISNALFSSTTIFDANSGSAVILREVNGQKLLIRLSPENWSEKNKMYDGIVF